MTPALVSLLAEQHRRANDPKRQEAGARQGSVSDLLMLSKMGG